MLGLGLGLPQNREVAAGGGGSPSLLASDAVFMMAENSYGAQAQTNDNVAWALCYSGFPGFMPIVFRHARGGDTLQHLISRWPQIAACNPKAIQLMNAQNSLGTGLAQMQADYETLYGMFIASGVEIIFTPTQTQTGSGSEATITALNTWLKDTSTGFARHPEVVIQDDYASVNLKTDATVHNGAQDHTNAKGAVLLGIGRAVYGDYFEPKYEDFTAQLAGNFNTDWNMPDTDANGISNGWALTNNYTGSTVVTAMGNFRSPGMTSVPCQILRISGTSAVDPVTAGNEMRFRKTVALPTATKMTGRQYNMVLFVELTNISADWATAIAPSNMATFSIAAGSAVLFNRQYTTSNGALILPAKFAGVMKTMPLMQPSQNINVTLDVNCRPMKDVAADIEVRFGWVNLIEEETTAYGAPYDQSEILPVGRPQIFLPPTFSGTASSGSSLTITRYGIVSGGGMVEPATQYGGGTNYPLNGFMVRSPYALPANVAGNIELARQSGAAAVPYTVQAGDVGTTLKFGVQWENSFGSLITYSAASATVT